ncbi:MAG: hypothetical protein HUK16_03770 [Bacteroidales bacterium]|nr:hypothetical protein [Bacteroidales bacterium]
MDEIIIGADELILWLRKNRIAEQTQTNTLGLRILRIMEANGATRLEDVPVYWPIIENHEHIGAFQLPQSATQYRVQIDSLPAIYRALLEL